MKIENFIYFFTVCGFFIGLTFSILNFNTPENILFYTGLITLFFYLLIHLAIANFLDINLISKKLFDKDKHEKVSDYFIYELESREKQMEELVTVLNKTQEINNKQVKQNGNNDKIAA